MSTGYQIKPGRIWAFLAVWRVGTPRAYLRQMIRKSDPGAPLAPSIWPEQDLRRLAETSPHLLEDIGFTKDKAQSGPGFTIWRFNGVASVVTYDP